MVFSTKLPIENELVIQTEEMDEHEGDDVRPEAIVYTWEVHYNVTGTEATAHPTYKRSFYAGAANGSPHPQNVPSEHVSAVRNELRWADYDSFEVHNDAVLYCAACGGRLADGPYKQEDES